MATRYSDKTKQEVVAFVKKFDDENGRGGQSAAKKKFNINPISIKKWCVDQGYVTGPSKKKKKAPASNAAPKDGTKRAPRKSAKRSRRTAAPAAAKSAASPVAAGSTTATLRKMSAISEKIESLQAEFETLKKSL